jgi:hypothetical protein
LDGYSVEAKVPGERALAGIGFLGREKRNGKTLRSAMGEEAGRDLLKMAFSSVTLCSGTARVMFSASRFAVLELPAHLVDGFSS